MSIEIIQGATLKPASSNELVNLLKIQTSMAGRLYIGYPIIGTSEGRYTIDAIYISEEKGIVMFDLIDGTDLNHNDCQSRQDDLANMLEAKLKLYRTLSRRRELIIPIHTVSFAPGARQPTDFSNFDKEYNIVVDNNHLLAILQQFNWPERDNNIYKNALSAIESVSTIRKGKPRKLAIDNSRGTKLKRLEDSIATLDGKQSIAVIETVEGVQRIRGLAGSGKTIILALKAAYFHAQHPEWRIAVTFNTRSLKGQFRRLIRNFSLEKTHEEPDWNNLRILNAWGAPGNRERDGVYHEYCRINNIDYLDFRSARAKFRGNEFAQVCKMAMQLATKENQIYDAILIDEAQDFSPEFLQLCYRLLKEPKRLVYAYDELQKLSGESLPSPEDIFGRNEDGALNVQFDTTNNGEGRQDIILERCYRNSGPVLVTAHALGFGIYRDPQNTDDSGLVQMFEHSQLWTEVGYQIKSGVLGDGEDVVLKRTDDTSPKFLESHSHIDDLIQFRSFATVKDQNEWLARAIEKNLREDELRHDDIVIINPDPFTTRKNVGAIRSLLLSLDINSHLAGVDTPQDVFSKSDLEDPEDSVIFTGIYRAKGNEAGMVYIINAQDCQSGTWNLATKRNQLFTAITRSKAWVRVLGVGDDMEKLIDEFKDLKRRNFELEFNYPTREQREHLHIIHRDMTKQELKRQQSTQRNLRKIVDDLKSDDLRIEDIDRDLLDELRDILS